MSGYGHPIYILLERMYNLINRLMKYRTEAYMKQDTLARIAGIGRSTISEIENGKRIPRVDTAILIAKALGKTVEEIWDL